MKTILSRLVLLTALTSSVSAVEWHGWESSLGGNGHFYTVIGANEGEVQNWYEARTEAAELGGHLVTFESSAELNFVRATFGKTELFWTGLTSTGGQGQFEWENGEAVTYTKFGLERPDANVASSVVINQQQLIRGVMGTRGFFGAVDPLSGYRGIVEYEQGIPASGSPTNVPDGGSPLVLIAISGAAGIICRLLKK